MQTGKYLLGVICLGAALSSSPVIAEEMIYSGFMSDYSQLRKVEDGSADYRYLGPDAVDRIAKYNAIIIDQPEIFIANDSPYRGVKPKHLDALAESARAGLVDALSEHIYVVDRPGENALYLTVALTNLKLTKVKKKAFNYLPVALVAGGVSSMASSDIAKKANFDALVFELEAFDSVSGERIVAIIDHLDHVEDTELSSWEEVDQFMAESGALIACRFRNAHLAEDARVDCLSSR